MNFGTIKKFVKAVFVAYVAAHVLLLVQAVRVFIFGFQVDVADELSQWVFVGGLVEAAAMTTVFYLFAHYVRAKVSLRELFVSALFAELLYTYALSPLGEKLLPQLYPHSAVWGVAAFIAIYGIILIIGRFVFPNGVMALTGERELFSEAEVRKFFDRLLRVFIAALFFASLVVGLISLPGALGWDTFKVEPGYMLLTIQYVALQFALILLLIMILTRPALYEHHAYTTGAACAGFGTLVLGLIPINAVAAAMPNAQLGTLAFLTTAAFTMYAGLAAYSSRKGV
ncbi:MAG: hypothetical protein KBD06_03980 [Candidatus Pacebacteria bacterium]|nr:hypothetical protein [Candidatus Paceibacterota bacterium]